MSKISVIVPVYNVEKYLLRCTDSILKQTFTDFELILVNDGSLDNSGYICDQLKENDKRIKVIHKENGGLSSARNAGIDAAQGNYITFIDSDDVVNKYYLQLLYNACVENGADIAMGRLLRFSQINAVNKDVIDEFVSDCITTEEVFKNFYNIDIAANYNSSCCKLYRKEIFNEIRFPVGRLFEDEFTTYKLYHNADKIMYLNIDLYYYFVNDSGITRNLSTDKRFDEYDAQYNKINFYYENGYLDIYDLALYYFLDSSKWDLKNCVEHKTVDKVRTKNFVSKYRLVLKKAKERSLLEFYRDYDFYLLAYPKRSFFYRIKRLFLK